MIFYGLTKKKFLQKNFLRTISFTEWNSVCKYAHNWESIWNSEDINFLKFFSISLPVTAKQYKFTSLYRHDWKKFTPELVWGNRQSLFYRKPHTIRNQSFKIILHRFMNIYILFNWKSMFKIYTNTFHINPRNQELTCHNLYLTFYNTRLYINLVNLKGLNCCSLSVGLLLKFFKNKKSLKKNKLLKILLMKYIRKLLIVADIRYINLVIKKTPVFLNELFNAFTTPIIAPFFNPITKTVYNDITSTLTKPAFNIKNLVFLKFKPYNSMKGHRKGRLKRKIMRRIVKSNRICD